MYAANPNMPHITEYNPVYNSRIYQTNTLETASAVGNFQENAMGYLNYSDMDSYPINQYQQTSVPMAVGSQRCSSVDERNTNNYYNLTPSRNPLPNSASSGHEYFSLQNMDNREPFACQQNDSQGQTSNRRPCRGNSDISTNRKNRTWTDAVFASMDREAESILDLVNEDAMELERIAATIKQDCRSPNSVDAMLPNDFAPMSIPSIGANSDMSYSRWSRPQFYDPNQRRRRISRSDTHYVPDDFLLSNDFQTFNIDSPPGQDFRYNDMLGIPAPSTVGHFNTNPSLAAYSRDSYQPHGFLNDLQTYHGASLYSTCRQSFGSDNMRAGTEVMLSEISRTYYKPTKDKNTRGRSKHGETDDFSQLAEASKMRRDHSKLKKTDYKYHLSDKIGSTMEESHRLLGKRKSEYPEDHDFQGKKPKYYFEHEGHYVVHKLLRELSSSTMPSDLPKTTSASLFYRLLSSKAEPRIMQTVGSSYTISSRSHKKIVVKEDVSEHQIGKYSKIGSHPFVYIHGASSRASPSKSVKLIELLTSKPAPTKTEENETKTEDAVHCSEDKSSAEETNKEDRPQSESGIDAIR